MSAGYYYHGEPMTGLFQNKRYDDISYTIDEFWEDARRGELANVMFVDPDYTDAAEDAGTSNDYHHRGNVQAEGFLLVISFEDVLEKKGHRPMAFNSAGNQIGWRSSADQILSTVSMNLGSLRRTFGSRGRSRSIVTSSLIRPGRADRTITRSESVTASSMSWVTKSTERRCSVQNSQQLTAHRALRLGIQSAERLVHEEDLRIIRKEAAEGDALAHSA